MSAMGSLQRNRGLITATVLLTVLSMVLGLIFFIIALQEDEEASLVVDEVYFVGREANDRELRVDVEVWITNDGDGTAKTIAVNIFAVEVDSNLGRANATSQFGELGGKRSARTVLSIDVPLNDTYRIEVLVLKDGKLTITGSGVLDLTKIGYPSGYGTDRNLDEEEREEEKGSAMDSICYVLGIIGTGSLVLIIVLIVAFSAKYSPERKEEGDFGRSNKGGPPAVRDGSSGTGPKDDDAETVEDEGRSLEEQPVKEPFLFDEETSRRKALSSLGIEDGAIEDKDGKVNAKMPRSLE